MTNKITFFKGKIVKTMTREELIEAVEELGGLLYEASLEYAGMINKAWASIHKVS